MSKRFAVMRDLLDHLEAGKIGAFDLGLYTIIHWQTDFKTGIWWGSAPKLLAAAPRGTTLRRVQESLVTLIRIGFLKAFRTPGKRGNYPVLISKYSVRTGVLRGKRLNAVKSTDWRNPCYELCTDGATDGATAEATDGAPIHLISKQNSGKNQNLQQRKNAGCANPQQPETQRQNAPLVPNPPVEMKGKNKTLLPQRQRYLNVQRLIEAAIDLRKKEERLGVALDVVSRKEDLKCYAAEHGIPYDSDSITKALDIAELKMSEGTGKALLSTPTWTALVAGKGFRRNDEPLAKDPMVTHK
jgi:hypothetical protein